MNFFHPSPQAPVDFKGPPVSVQNVNKRYKNGTWANREISLTTEPGEILGILGPNGAGKTTLVRQITTELLPSSGKIQVMGQDVVSQPVLVKSMLGIMPQDVDLFDYLTVFQHLRIFAKLRGIAPSKAAQRAEELISDLELLDHRDVPVGKLSGGLRRRVLVGIAVVARPPVMVLDEPTTGLDPQSRRNLWSSLRRYREEGTFILLTTHSMEEAEALCDRVGIIQGGRLLALDTVSKLRADYRFEFKVTYFPSGSTEEGLTIYGADDQELIARVREMGFHQFSVAQTSLEDVYLGLTGEMEDFNDRES